MEQAAERLCILLPSSVQNPPVLVCAARPGRGLGWLSSRDPSSPAVLQRGHHSQQEPLGDIVQPGESAVQIFNNKMGLDPVRGFPNVFHKNLICYQYDNIMY